MPFNNVPLSLWGNVYSPGYSYTTLTNRIHLLFLGQDLASILGYVYPLRGCAELAHALKNHVLRMLQQHYEVTDLFVTRTHLTRFCLEYISTSTLMYHLTRYDNMKSIRYYLR